jgi:hypothetical protein
MIPNRMRHDALLRFARCLIDNGDGTFSIRTTSGSASGNNCGSSYMTDTMKMFDKTVDASVNSVRTVNV